MSNNLVKIERGSLLFLIKLLVLVYGATSCQSKKQVEEARKISGVNTETSDIIISDSAATQTKGVRVGNAYLQPNNLILENISLIPNIKSFKRLLQKTDLTKTLIGKGPFTLFIPTDEAFQKLNAGEIQRLLRATDDAPRNNLLEHHLVPGKIIASDLGNQVVLKAANGKALQVKNNGQTIQVNEATIKVKDGVSTNGVIHIIDRVLLPEAE